MPFSFLRLLGLGRKPVTPKADPDYDFRRSRSGHLVRRHKVTGTDEVQVGNAWRLYVPSGESAPFVVPKA